MQKKVTGEDPSAEDVRLEFMRQKSEATSGGSKPVRGCDIGNAWFNYDSNLVSSLNCVVVFISLSYVLWQGTMSTLTDMSERLKSMESGLPQVESKLSDRLNVVETAVAKLMKSVESNFAIVIAALNGSKPTIEVNFETGKG